MSDRPDDLTPLLDRLASDTGTLRLVDAESVRRRGRQRSRHQAIGSALAAVVVLALVVVGAGALDLGGSDRSAPPANHTPTASATPTSPPSPTVSTPFASLPTLAQVTTALGGCCGSLAEAAETTPAGDCLSTPVTVQGSPVPTRRLAATGDGGLVVAVTLYQGDAGTVGGLLQDAYSACATSAGHHQGFDQPGATVGGARLVSVTGAASGGGVAQQYAGWAPASGGVEALVQISFTGNGDLGPHQVEKLLKAAVDTAA